MDKYMSEREYRLIRRDIQRELHQKARDDARVAEMTQVGQMGAHSASDLNSRATDRDIDTENRCSVFNRSVRNQGTRISDQNPNGSPNVDMQMSDQNQIVDPLHSHSGENRSKHGSLPVKSSTPNVHGGKSASDITSSFRTVDVFSESIDLTHEIEVLDKKLVELLRRNSEKVNDNPIAWSKVDKDSDLVGENSVVRPKVHTEPSFKRDGGLHMPTNPRRFSAVQENHRGVHLASNCEKPIERRPAQYESRIDDVVYNITNPRRTEQDRDTQVSEEDRLVYDIQKERDLIRRLSAQEKQIDEERVIKEEEEVRLNERIARLREAEGELKDLRQERERLEQTVRKKAELEALRQDKLSLLRRHEEYLSHKVDSELKLKGSMSENSMEEMTQHKLLGEGQGINWPRQIVHAEGSMTAPVMVPMAPVQNAFESASKFGKPPIPCFLGEDFEIWKIQVESILKSKMYPERLIAQTVRSCLKGETKKVLLTLDNMASSWEILEKLEDFYGNTQSRDNIMQDFFNAKQGEKEPSSKWALRLESIMKLAIETGEITEKRRNTLLKQRFWKGLNNDQLKNNTRITYESDASFETLRKKTRVEEDELKRVSGGSKQQKQMVVQGADVEVENFAKAGFIKDEMHLHQVNMKSSSSLFDQQMTMMKSLMEKMSGIEKELADLKKENKERKRSDHAKSEDINLNSGKKRNRFNRWQKKDKSPNEQETNDHLNK